MSFYFVICSLLTLSVIVLKPVEKRLVEEVQKNDILIIVGETGSGKTTRKYACLISTTLVGKLKVNVLMLIIFFFFFSHMKNCLSSSTMLDSVERER